MSEGRTTTRPIDEEHGTTRTYNLGCRCEPCVKAKSKYQHELYLRKQAAREMENSES